MKRVMRFPSIAKAVTFALLEITAVLLRRWGMALYFANKIVPGAALLLASYALFITAIALFILAEHLRQKEEREKSEYIRLSDAYQRQIDYVRSRQHDLKNRLMVISGMLKKSADRPSGASLEFIERTGEQINEISMLLKLDSSALGLLLFQKCKQAYDKGAELKLKSYVAQLPDPLAQSQLDLVDVMGNLLDNAIEATGAGGKIFVEIGEMDGFFYISVMNSGELAGDGLDEIFRAGYSTKGEHRGYGLYNVKRIVMRHGGNIELTVNEGRVEFRVYLPLAA